MKTKVVAITATSIQHLTEYVLVPENATKQELYDFLIVDDTNSLIIAEAMTSEDAGDWEWGEVLDVNPSYKHGLSFVDELLEEREEREEIKEEKND